MWYGDFQYVVREVRDDVICVREINREDIELLRKLNIPVIYEREFILARCLRRINNIIRYKFNEVEWWEFIVSLDYRDKRKYLEEIRKLTYLEKGKRFKIYF